MKFLTQHLACENPLARKCKYAKKEYRNSDGIYEYEFLSGTRKELQDQGIEIHHHEKFIKETIK